VIVIVTLVPLSFTRSLFSGNACALCRPVKLIAVHMELCDPWPRVGASSHCSSIVLGPHIVTPMSYDVILKEVVAAPGHIQGYFGMATVIVCSGSGLGQSNGLLSGGCSAKFANLALQVSDSETSRKVLRLALQ